MTESMYERLRRRYIGENDLDEELKSFLKEMLNEVNEIKDRLGPQLNLNVFEEIGGLDKKIEEYHKEFMSKLTDFKDLQKREND